MLRGLYTSTSGMLAQQQKMNVVANNLANATTNGYKKDDVVFREFPKYLNFRLKDEVFLVGKGSVDLQPEIGKLGTGVTVDAIVTNHEQGQLVATGNKFDFALYGQGFYEIETSAGSRYTRDGSFVKDRDGYLVNYNGNKLLGTDGQPIKINDLFFAVNENGDVIEYTASGKKGEKLGQIKIVRFPEKHGLRKVGKNLYYATKDAGNPETVNGNNVIVRQGYIEKSNVNVVSAMVNMIEVNRAYEANSKLIKTQDSMLGQSISQVGAR
jgi:flagellar basal-body rod protein FlgG